MSGSIRATPNRHPSVFRPRGRVIWKGATGRPPCRFRGVLLNGVCRITGTRFRSESSSAPDPSLSETPQSPYVYSLTSGPYANHPTRDLVALIGREPRCLLVTLIDAIVALFALDQLIMIAPAHAAGLKEVRRGGVGAPGFAVAAGEYGNRVARSPMPPELQNRAWRLRSW
jgi:hypothetical protein